jgi:hypothetical protein
MWERGGRQDYWNGVAIFLGHAEREELVTIDLRALAS